MIQTESHTDSLSLASIQEAQRRIQPYVHQTPVLESEQINRRLGCRVLFKAESLQKTGSFKIRGASHFFSHLSPEVLTQGVVAFSSGNHAQAVACAAQLFASSATIVMPEDSPAVKVAGTRFWGGKVVFYNRYEADREAIAKEIQAKTGATLIPPFDHPWIVMGQGTAALSFLEQVTQSKTVLDAFLVPCSGGGLTAGCGTVFKALSPQTKVLAIEPQGYDDTVLSLVAGERIKVSPAHPTACDGLMMTQPGQYTFDLNRHLVDEAVVVSDAQVFEAMRWLFDALKLVVEPSGAVGLAALLARPEAFRGQTVGVLLSGGNVDRQVFQQVLSEG